MLKGVEQVSQELEMMVKLVRDGQFHLLPKDIWFKIYEYYLFDFDNYNKHDFNLVCKYFDSLAKDKKIIHDLVEKYFPVFLDTHIESFNDKGFIAFLYQDLGFKLPLIDKPLEFIPAYILANMIRGKDFNEIVESLRNRLTLLYSQLQNSKLLLKEMDEAFEDTDNKNFVSVVVGFQGKKAPQGFLKALSFEELLSAYLAASNIRALVDLFTINELSFEREECFRWAASISDLNILSHLTEQKIRELNGFYKPLPQELLDLKELIEAGNIKEIRRIMGVDFDEVEIQSKLNSSSIVSTLSKKPLNDVFAEMNAHTFYAFKKLAGNGKLQEKLLKRLILADRIDLIPLVELNNKSVLSVKPMVKKFLMVAKKLESLDVKIRNKAFRMCHAILANSNLRSILMESPLIAQWCCRNDQMSLVAEYFAGKNLINNGRGELNLDIRDEDDKWLVNTAFKWALLNDDRLLILNMMSNVPLAFIPRLVDLAASLDHVDPILPALSNISGERLEIFVIWLFIHASATTNEKLMTYLQENFAQNESAAAKYALFLFHNRLTHKINWALRKLVFSAKFEYSNAFGALAVYILLHSLKHDDFLNRFITLHAADIPAHHVLKSIEFLSDEFRKILFQKALDAGNFNSFARLSIRDDLLKLTRFPYFVDALRRNPLILVSFIGSDYEEDDANMVLEIFGPYLDTATKCSLLALPEHVELAIMFIRLFPQELTYDLLCKTFGEEHYITQLAPRSFLSRVGSYLGTYLPGFSVAKDKRPLDETDENDKDSENIKKAKKK